jgi:spore germination cell wall hydrolase CwlJ-like protein
MNRIVRAAAFAAAAFALVASAGMPSAVQAEAAQSVPAVQLGGHDGAALAESDLALNDIDAAPAAAPQEKPGFFSQLFQHAVSAIAGDAPEQTGQARPMTLPELVLAYQGTEAGDSQQECLANAVYFEARSEPIEGQLAVAEVVLNRTVSGRYPADICSVVTQPAQFSFIIKGRFPKADRESVAWRNAVAVAQIAQHKLADQIPSNVLWYHATYVSPSWGKRLNKQAQIGLHIFYS